MPVPYMVKTESRSRDLRVSFMSFSLQCLVYCRLHLQLDYFLFLENFLSP